MPLVMSGLQSGEKNFKTQMLNSSRSISP